MPKSSTVMATPEKMPFYDPETRITIMLPLLEDDGGSSVKVDQYETVNIINDVGTIASVRIQRGVRVEVTPSVYLALMPKYPNL